LRGGQAGGRAGERGWWGAGGPAGGGARRGARGGGGGGGGGGGPGGGCALMNGGMQIGVEMGVCRVWCRWEEATRVDEGRRASASVKFFFWPSANIRKSPETRRAFRKSFGAQNLLDTTVSIPPSRWPCAVRGRPHASHTVVAISFWTSKFWMGLVNDDRLAGQYKLRTDLSWDLEPPLAWPTQISDGA
jgi:hypothetical protein